MIFTLSFVYLFINSKRLEPSLKTEWTTSHIWSCCSESPTDSLLRKSFKASSPANNGKSDEIQRIFFNFQPMRVVKNYSFQLRAMNENSEEKRVSMKSGTTTNIATLCHEILSYFYRVTYLGRDYFWKSWSFYNLQ